MAEHRFGAETLLQGGQQFYVSRMVIGQRFELKDVPDAMRQLAAGNASGKTAIIVRPAELAKVTQ